MFKSILCKTRIKSVEFLSALLSVVLNSNGKVFSYVVASLNIAETKPFHLGYSSLACTIGIVDVFEAIDHMHDASTWKFSYCLHGYKKQ